VVDLYPTQEQAVNKLRNGSILWGGVGTGKSITAAAYYVKNETPKDIYVITTAMKRDLLDWEKEFAKFGIGKTTNATIAGVLTVDSWNNIGRYRDVKGAFFIFDEQRLVGSGEWTKNFLKISQSNRWILLTATPGDTWLDYIPVFVANGFYKNRTHFKREHVIYNTFTKFPKVDRYVNTGRLVKLRNQLLVEMPYIRHTTRVITEVEVEYDKDLFKKVMEDRWNPYEDRPLRDVAELFLVMRKVVNSDLTRLSAIRALIQKHPKLIVFYNFDYELEILRSLVNGISKGEGENESWPIQKPVGTTSLVPQLQVEKNVHLSNSTALVAEQTFPKKLGEGKTTSTTLNTTVGSTFQIAEWNGHKHEPIPDTDRWVYLVQYVAGAEGWNCISTDAMCFYSLTYSYKIWHQAHGRIDRLNTPFSTLYYYVLKSKSFIDQSVGKSLESKRNFNESSFIKKVADIRG
jgi:hypothetical protein